MADLLSSYKTSTKGFKLGDKVKGRVIEKTNKALVLDIGGKSEGLVAEKAFIEAKDFIRQLKIGDEVAGQVIVSETPDGYTIISLRNASKDYVWRKIEDLQKKNGEVNVEVKNANPSGLVVDFYGLTGFIPSSHIGKKTAKQISNLTGKALGVKIIEVDRNLNKVVLSEKAVSEAEEVKEQEEAMADLKVNQTYSGEVTTVTDFGVFVKVQVSKKGKEEISLEGLVHISEISWGKTQKPADSLIVGQKVKVRVVDVKNGKLSLSMKQAEEDPWEKVEKKYQPDKKVKGKVVKVSDFGVFIALEPGVEGLVHMTKIPPATRLHEGDEVNVYVEEVNAKTKKISLGLVLTDKPIGYK